jgi:hypothetical protein
MSTISSTGGRIVQTANSVFHYCNSDRFINDYETDRSGKNSVDADLKFDFSQFPVTMPKSTIVGRVVTFR